MEQHGTKRVVKFNIAFLHVGRASLIPCHLRLERFSAVNPEVAGSSPVGPVIYKHFHGGRHAALREVSVTLPGSIGGSAATWL